MKIPKVKICCIKNEKEANTAIAMGASAIGLVSSMPSGPGVIEEVVIKEIVDKVRNKVKTFLLTSLVMADDIIAQHKRIGSSTIQLVDAIRYRQYELLRRAIPGIELVQVIHVRGKSSLDEAIEVSQYVDMILLDSGNPDLSTKELGGTGRVHNWAVSKMIVEQVNVPVFLAGGLNPSNVQKAVTEVNPYGLDLCSGVRTNDNLDFKKLTRFFKALNSI